MRLLVIEEDFSGSFSPSTIALIAWQTLIWYVDHDHLSTPAARTSISVSQ